MSISLTHKNPTCVTLIGFDKLLVKVSKSYFVQTVRDVLEKHWPCLQKKFFAIRKPREASFISSSGLNIFDNLSNFIANHNLYLTCTSTTALQGGMGEFSLPLTFPPNVTNVLKIKQNKTKKVDNFSIKWQKHEFFRYRKFIPPLYFSLGPCSLATSPTPQFWFWCFH